jgi:hypothetical protein
MNRPTTGVTQQKCEALCPCQLGWYVWLTVRGRADVFTSPHPLLIAKAAIQPAHELQEREWS